MLKIKEVNIIRNHELEANISGYPTYDEIYEAIDPDALDGEILRIHQCVNEMDNALSEIDRYDPGTFRRIAEQLAKVI